MSEPFRETINVDIRDSVPDWAPFEPAQVGRAMNKMFRGALHQARCRSG